MFNVTQYSKSIINFNIYQVVLLFAVKHKHAKTTSNSIDQFLSFLCCNYHYHFIQLCDFDIKCHLMSATKMRIVVCDFSAVRGFQAEIWNGLTKSFLLCVYVCMLVSILPVCLQLIISHVTAPLSQLISITLNVWCAH